MSTATLARAMAPAARDITRAESARRCGRCERALNPDEPVWLQRCGRQLTSVCWRCQNEGAAYWPERPCGHCQRPVSAVSWAARASTVVFCSRGCRTEGRRAVPRQCATCGKGFAPKRSDALTCSAACRQRAYRQRVTDNRLRKASASESVTAYRKGEAGAASNRTGEANIPRFLDRRTVTDVVAVARRREGRGA